MNDDFLKVAIIGLAAFAVFKLAEPAPYAAPYYVPYYFPWINYGYFGAPGWGGFPPFGRPPLGDGEGVEHGEMFGGGHGGGHGR